MSNKNKKQNRIEVTDKITGMLRDEFGYTGVAILNALKFYSFSDEAKKIRARAIELMDNTQIANRELYLNQNSQD